MYSAAGETPIATRLASFTQVRGLAFGNYAEVSPDVEDLILQCGHALARKHWRSSGARNEAEARSWWVSHCRMRIGVATARAYARYRLKRLVFVGVPRAVLDERAQRGLAGGARDAGANGGGGHTSADLQQFWQHQVHVRVNAD